MDSRVCTVSDVGDSKSSNVNWDAGLALLVKLDEAGELSTVARVAELSDILRVGVEGDQSNQVGGVMMASEQPSISTHNGGARK